MTDAATPRPGGILAVYAGIATVAWVLLQLVPEARGLAPWLFVATALCYGLPHGAADLWVGLRMFPAISFLGGYLLVMSAGAGAWFLAPRASFVAFLGLTVFHWGTGDFRRGDFSLADWLLLGLTRGVLVIGGAVAADPLAASTLALQVTGSALEMGRAAGIALGLALPLHALALLRWGGRAPTPAAWTLVESALLLAAAWLLPAFASVALYFGLVHARRHLWRVRQLPQCGVHDTPRWRFALMVVATIIPVAAIAMLAARSGLGVSDAWVRWYFLALAALTWPHALLVLELDRGESDSRQD